MLNAAALLTVATLAGLVLGFLREWLIIHFWGAGDLSDSFVLAVFLPDAIRTALAAGLLNSAAIPLYKQQPPGARQKWINALGVGLLGFSMLLAAGLSWFADSWIGATGPGLTIESHAVAAAAFAWLAWCIPGLFLHTFFTIILHLQQRFVLVGLGSFLFNLFPVLCLLIARERTTVVYLSMACVAGSAAMALVALPSVWRSGWRPGELRYSGTVLFELSKRLGPLLLSNLAGQGIMLLEKIIASYLGSGTITLLNLARKLINLPLVALMSLNQVIFVSLSLQEPSERLRTLRSGLSISTALSLPAAVGMLAVSPSVVYFIFPAVSDKDTLSLLIAWFSVPLLLGAWNALLARYAYADNDTELPLRCELIGSFAQAALLIGLGLWLGPVGFAFANLVGVALTCLLLLQRQRLLSEVPWLAHWSLGLACLAVPGYWIHTLPPGWAQAAWATVAGAATLVLCLAPAGLRRWRAG